MSSRDGLPNARDLDYRAADARLVDRGYEPAPAPRSATGVTAAVTGATDRELPGTDAEKTRAIEGTSEERKLFPMARGLLDYFPDALAAVANGSWVGNEKHNPGEEMHHARGKSTDHADCAIRHLVQRGGWDNIITKDGRTFHVRHSTWAAWRALANLQEEIERDEGLPLPRGAKP